jgi:hypothetical protein
MLCIPCKGTGFMNLEEVPIEVLNKGRIAIKKWISSGVNYFLNEPIATLCECCFDFDEGWWNTAIPGDHMTSTCPNVPSVRP